MYIKKQHEIEQIIEGGRLMGKILEDLANMVQPELNTFELDQIAEEMILKVGGRPAFKGYKTRFNDPPFPSTICASVNHELVHGIARKDKVLKDGDIFSIDIGMQYPAKNGFFTDTAVTVPVGNVDKKIKKCIDATQQALQIGIAAAQAGNTVADIGAAIEQYIQPFGYGIVRDLVGHGVGHAVHEEPRVPNFYDTELEAWVLKPGVVIAIEPMITLGSYDVETEADNWTISTVDKSLNAHFEHTIIITKDGPVVATKRPSE